MVVTVEEMIAAVNENPSEYEERYIRWVSVGHDKKKLSELLYEIKYLKEEKAWPERIAFLESILAEYDSHQLYNLLTNDPQTVRFAMIEKWARQAAMEILIFGKYGVDTLNTITQFPMADYRLVVKRVQEIVNMITDISTQSAALASGVPGL
jgi:hypothetical protein